MRERTRESRHQEWVADRAYSQFFASPSIIWASWIDNQPHKCPCGCGEVWYGSNAGTNMLAYLFPIVLFRLLKNTKALFPLFGAIYALLWGIARVTMPHKAYRGWLSEYFRIWLDIFWRPATGGAEPRSRLRAFITRSPLILIGATLMPVALVVWAGVFVLIWILLISIFPATLTLHIASLVLLVLLFASLSVLAAIYVVARGLAFVVAGVASIIYSSHSEIGIALIALGILIEYAFKFHGEKRLRYQLGRIIAHQQLATTVEPTCAD